MTYMRLVICSLRAGWTVPQLALRFTLPWSTQSRWPIFCCIFYISFSDVLSPNVFREVLRKFSFVFLTAVYQRTEKRWYTNCPLFGSIWRRSWNSHHFNHIIRIVTTVAGQVWPLWAVLLSLTWGQPSLSLSSSMSSNSFSSSTNSSSNFPNCSLLSREPSHVKTLHIVNTYALLFHI